MSTIVEISKRLLSRRPKVEPILSQLFLQHGTNLLVETSETSNTSVDQDDEDSGSNGKTNSSVDKGKSKALEADFMSGANSKNQSGHRNQGGEGKKSKKNTSGKGGWK